ncbi:MAG: hypothetical protein M1826_004650 [Phylliscum demangeonii]|nr:MAG: hypothetical protein M1826_004650 [Phylliscum demangeonii]
MPVLLLAVLSLLALLGLVQSTPTKSGPGALTPAEDRADPADYREYLGWEGHGDQSSTFMAKCIAEMVAEASPFIKGSYVDSLMVECKRLGEHQGLVMLEPYASDWARYTEFLPFLICFLNHVAHKHPSSSLPLRANLPPHLKDKHAQAVLDGFSSCRSTLPATIVHRPTVPGVVHDAAPATEHGASHPPLQFHHPAARRAGLLHSVARFGRLAPELLREMGPAVQRAETTWERRPQLIEY